MSGISKRLRRTLLLVPYLARKPEGVKVDALARTLNLSRAEMNRELEKLMMVGRPGGDPNEYVNIVQEGSGANARVFAITDAGLGRPPRLTTGEAFALLLGVGTLEGTGVAEFDRAVHRAEKKIRAALRSADQAALAREAKIVLARNDAGANPNPRPGDHSGSILDTLARAHRQSRVVELDYSSVSSQRRKQIRVEPYGLLNHQGFWYLLGKSRTHKAQSVYVFKVERVLAAVLTDQTFVQPKNFSTQAFLRDRAFFANVQRSKITLHVHGATAKVWRSADKKVRPIGRGSLEVTFRDYPSGWLAAWVVRQGPDVQVIAPPALQQQVARLAHTVARAHE